MIDFPSWLEEQLAERGYIQAEFARKIGVSRATINGVLTRRRGPGRELLNKIATGFALPLDEVYRAAGLLPPKDTDIQADRLLHLISLLSPTEREFITTTIEALIKHHETEKITQKNTLPE